jgi:ABC-type transporter Mla subunit MlaD
MQLAELQVDYSKRTNTVNELEARVDRLIVELHQERKRANDLKEIVDRRNDTIRQLMEQRRQMVKVISQTSGFYEFIISRTWKAGATDCDMVMAYMAQLPEA